MKKIFISVFVLLFLVMEFDSTFAQRGKDRQRDGKEFMQLKLSESQKEKIKEIRFAHEDYKIDLTAKLKKNRLNIKKMVVLNDVNESNLLESINNGSEIKSELTRSKVKMWLDIRNILNDEQKEIWSRKFNSFIMRNKSSHDGEKRTFREKRKIAKNGVIKRKMQ